MPVIINSIKFILIALNIDKVTGSHKKKSSLIYVLLWTIRESPPFHTMGSGRENVVRSNCSFQNCFITDNRNYFASILDYDAILFNVMQLHRDENHPLPLQRAPNQKYVMVSVEPAGMYPISEKYNGYFNLTWTYRFSSDVPLPYFMIKDQFGQVVGPKPDMHWISRSSMNETEEYVKRILRNKKIAAAWFVSNCYCQQRLYFVEDIQKELAKYGHRVDVYGQCGQLKCSSPDACLASVQSDYYFYLAFENSFDEDYVTEKLLTGLQHLAVPVVYGSSNYSRFMPPGIYLNAYKLGAKKVAQRMVKIINNTQLYHSFFKWHGHYSYHATDQDGYSREVCALCVLLNNNTRSSETSAILSNITGWWSAYFVPSPERIRLIEDDHVPRSGVVGFVENIYNYIFGD